MNLIVKLFVLFILFNGEEVFSQIYGKWVIINCYPEVTGLTNKEITEFKKECFKKEVQIDTTNIKLLGSVINGKLSAKVDSVNVVDNSEIPDSVSHLLRYPCQEINYFNLVTKETLTFIDKSYKKDFVKVLKFRCKEDKSSTCIFIYLLERNKICLCICGDGFYYLERM